MNIFLARVKELLESGETTQTQVAKLASVSQGTVSKWLSDERSPSLDEAAAICAGLGIRLELGAENVSHYALREQGPPYGATMDLERRAKTAEGELARIKAILRTIVGDEPSPASSNALDRIVEAVRSDLHPRPRHPKSK